MSRKDVIYGYMMNEKHVIAEMLYDTITRYENILNEMSKTAEVDRKILAVYKKKWKEDGVYEKHQWYLPIEIKLPLRTTGVNETLAPTC